MQLAISLNHTFDDIGAFAAFSQELKALCDKFFSGPSVSARGSESAVRSRRAAAVDTAPLEPQPAQSPAVEVPPLTVLEVAPTQEPLVLNKEGFLGSVPSVSDAATTPKAKRSRRTKAEMAAARDAAPLQLPASGSFGGPTTTSAPTAPSAPPADDPFALPGQKSVAAPVAAAPASTGTATRDDVRAAFAAVYVHEEAEPKILAVLSRFGIPQVKDAKPEQYADLVAALNAIGAELAA